MIKKYKSNFYNFPIEVENIDGEILVKIFTEDKKEIIYSWYNLQDKTSYSPYIKNAILASFIGEIPKNILILGFGAGSYAKYFKDHLGNNINITGVEIDESMIEIAKNEFNLKNINYLNLDYIESINILNKKKNNKFDIIFIDLYDKNSKIPESLNNLETLENIKNLLSKNGKIIINFANYNENKNYYKKIEDKLKQLLKNKENINLLNGKNDFGNIIGVYNLDKKINSQDLLLEYLTKVQVGLTNYDSNLISKIFLK